MQDEDERRRQRDSQFDRQPDTVLLLVNSAFRRLLQLLEPSPANESSKTRLSSTQQKELASRPPPKITVTLLELYWSFRQRRGRQCWRPWMRASKSTWRSLRKTSGRDVKLLLKHDASGQAITYRQARRALSNCWIALEIDNASQAKMSQALCT